MIPAGWGPEGMNNTETLALWQRGKDAWNAWAAKLLEAKKVIDDTGSWRTDWFGEGENSETKAWLLLAAADFTGHEFAAANFSGFIFPGPAKFQGARFAEQASFQGTIFHAPAQFAGTQFKSDVLFAAARFESIADFSDCNFAGQAGFERAEFMAASSGPLVPSARFPRARFGGRADFRSASFNGNTEFTKAHFETGARFDEAAFKGETTFQTACFTSMASFGRARFSAAARFSEAQFFGEARFSELTFNAQAACDKVQFLGDASFRQTKFLDAIDFSDAEFAKLATFDKCEFGGIANFHRTSFSAPSSFTEALFSNGAEFTETNFASGASINNVSFRGDVSFTQARFGGAAVFSGTRFLRDVTFQSMTTETAFVLAEAHFRNPPVLSETGFQGGPDLEDIRISDPLKRWRRWKNSGHSDPRPLLLFWMKVAKTPQAAFRYRRLRRLALEARDETRAHEFHVQERRCRRFWHDKPFGHGFTAFWLGLFYGSISDFGRSLIKPFMLWLLSIIVFAGIYYAIGGGKLVTTAAFPQIPASLDWATAQAWFINAADWFIASMNGVVAEAKCHAGNSQPMLEALYLSAKNAVVAAGWDSPETARRVYGCLYGLEEGTPVIPIAVSAVALVQQILSATLIFLFLLALKNTMKSS